MKKHCSRCGNEFFTGSTCPQCLKEMLNCSYGQRAANSITKAGQEMVQSFNRMRNVESAISKGLQKMALENGWNVRYNGTDSIVFSTEDRTYELSLKLKILGALVQMPPVPKVPYRYVETIDLKTHYPKIIQSLPNTVVCYERPLTSVVKEVEPGRYWIAWWATIKDGGFTLCSPWWISAQDMHGRTKFCAAVKAKDTDDAKRIIRESYDNGGADLAWEFCEAKPDYWNPFCDRFQRKSWMKW